MACNSHQNSALWEHCGGGMETKLGGDLGKSGRPASWVEALGAATKAAWDNIAEGRFKLNDVMLGTCPHRQQPYRMLEWIAGSELLTAHWH